MVGVKIGTLLLEENLSTKYKSFKSICPLGWRNLALSFSKDIVGNGDKF